MKSRISLFVLFFLLFATYEVSAQRGKHGAKVVSAANTIVNEYTTLSADITSGATSLTVASSSLNANGRFSGSLAAGDLIMIIQVQGATIQTGTQTISYGDILSYNNCGLYEFAQVLTVPNGTTINVECPLVNNYTATGRTEVIRVPRYTSLTINNGGVLTGDTWNGSIGGVCAVEVENSTVINTGGQIDMSGKGFRGGVLNDNNYSWGIGEYYYPTNDFGAEKGEGIAGSQTDYDALGGRYCRGAAANGGGGANTHNHGGGGGANAGDISLWTGTGNPDNSIANYVTAWNLEGAGFAFSTSTGGGRGGYSFSSSNQNELTLGPWNTNGNSGAWGGDLRRFWGGLGGRPLDYSTGRIFMGGGGGAGEQNDSKGSSGANGGGIIYIQSYGTISGAGQIISNGNTALNSTSGNGVSTTGADGAGGGGGGGTIILRSVGAASGISATANGGTGGNQVINSFYNSQQSQAEGPGGGGGGGYIAITSGAITCTTNGGANGTSNSSGITNFPPNGATKGGNGINNASITTFWIIDNDDTICPGNSVTLTASLGGSPPSGTTIIWYDAIVGGNVLATGPTYTTPVLYTTTTYYVGTCTGTYHDSVTVYVIQPTANAGNDVSICSGASTQLNASGGVTYAWSPALGLSATNIANPVANPTTTTTYVVTVTNSAGCTATDDVIVTISGNINANAGNDVSICPGASTNLSASGGTTYAWSPAVGLSSSTVANPTASPTTTITYIVTVTNASGCTDTDDVTVTVYPGANANAGNDTTICNTGSAQLNASGGTTYAWSPSTGLSATNISNPVAAPTSTQTYVVTVTDVNGCTDTDNITVTVSSNLVVNVTPSSPTTCPGGSVSLTASGGTTYTWSPATGLSATTGATVASTPASTTTYTVSASNSSGCTGSATVTVTIGANLIPTISPASPTVCTGNSVLLTASGGTTYLWSPATGLSATTGATVSASPTTQTTYTVSVTDASGCSGTASVTVNVSSSLIIAVTPSSASICPGSNVQLDASGATNYTWSPTTGLSSTIGATVIANPTVTTTYNVTGTDASGCSGSTTVTITISNNLTATATSTDENCGQADGTATVTPAGNCSSGYTYLWNTTPTQQTTQTATGLSAATYSCTVTCGGCSAATSVTVNNTAGPSASVSALNDAACGFSNGSATITPVGGAAPYTYLWSNGQTSANLQNVPAGVYSVTVTDANGCQAINTVTILSLPGPSVIIQSTTNASCFQSNGGATINVSGGTTPYTYTWNSTPVQTTQNLQNVPAGNYTVTVSDAGGCTATTSVFISQSGGLVLTATSTDEDCGLLNGTVTVVATQGTGAYSYNWSTSPPQSSATVNGLAAGNYIVTVTDGVCTVTASVVVGSNPGPSAGFSEHPSTTTVGGEVSFTDNSTGNPVNWQWDFGDGSSDITQSPSHTYNNIGTFIVTLIITDANGCTDTYIDTVEVHDIFTFYIPNTFSPNDDGTNDQFAPKGISVDPDNYEMLIFDRWGNCIFQSQLWNTKKNEGEGWNGTINNKGDVETDIVMDVYVYRIRVKDLNGVKHQYFGRIALIP